jgi:hypothetical protein
MKPQFAPGVALTIAVLLGCSDLSAPDDGQLMLRPDIRAPLQIVGSPGQQVIDLPTVRLYVASTLKPVAGQTVRFLLMDPDGNDTTVVMATDADGVARLPAWRLGDRLGHYTATVRVDGCCFPVIFTVHVPGEVAATYDLKSINGMAIPFNDTWGSEDHLILYESGFYNRFRREPTRSFTAEAGILGTYGPVGHDRIVFRTDCLLELGRCFSDSFIGVVSGAQLVVDRTDEFGPWVLVYGKR